MKMEISGESIIGLESEITEEEYETNSNGDLGLSTDTDGVCHVEIHTEDVNSVEGNTDNDCLNEIEIKQEIMEEEENSDISGDISKQPPLYKRGSAYSNKLLPPKKRELPTCRCFICGTIHPNFSNHMRKFHPDQLLFHCEKCGMGFMVKRSFEKHVEKHHIEEKNKNKGRSRRVYACPKCKKRYEWKKTLARHLRSGKCSLPKRVKVPEIYECKICDKLYTRKDTLKNHNKRTHSGMMSGAEVESYDGLIVCRVCGKIFMTKEERFHHEREHRKPPYICSICQSEFKSKSTLVKHVKTHLQGRFVCETCGSSFAYLTTLKRHILRHNNVIKFLCEYCGKGYTMLCKFKAHLRVHTLEPIPKPFGCSECDMTFRDRTNLENHMRKHTKERPFVCNICGKALGDKRTLKMHQARHNGENQFQCPICQKTFAYASYRTVHMRIHTQEKPFKCEECQKHFSQKSSLNTHMKSHSAEKNYICNECGKAFTIPHYLKVHMRSHTGDKPFKCHHCSKTFPQKSRLTAHLEKCQQ